MVVAIILAGYMIVTTIVADTDIRIWANAML